MNLRNEVNQLIKEQKLTNSQMEFMSTMEKEYTEQTKVKCDLKKSTALTSDAIATIVAIIGGTIVLTVAIAAFPIYYMEKAQIDSDLTREMLSKGYQQETVSGYSTPVWRKKNEENNVNNPPGNTTNIEPAGD